MEVTVRLVVQPACELCVKRWHCATMPWVPRAAPALFLLRDPLYGTCQSLDPPLCTPTSRVFPAPLLFPRDLPIARAGVSGRPGAHGVWLWLQLGGAHPVRAVPRRPVQHPSQLGGSGRQGCGHSGSGPVTNREWRCRVCGLHDGVWALLCPLLVDPVMVTCLLGFSC